MPMGLVGQNVSVPIFFLVQDGVDGFSYRLADVPVGPVLHMADGIPSGEKSTNIHFMVNYPIYVIRTFHGTNGVPENVVNVKIVVPGEIIIRPFK